MAAFVLPSPSDMLKASRKVMAAIGYEVCGKHLIYLCYT
jgi:hypothetical protein